MFQIKSFTFGLLLVLPLVSVSVPALAQDAGSPANITAPEKEYSPYLGHNYPDKVLWGDTHLHTSYSADAGMFGNRLGPDSAYRFAKGEEVTSTSGVRARLLRPLDWLVIADHAENLGLAPMIEESNPSLLKSEWGRKVHDLVKAGDIATAYGMWGEGATSNKDPLAGNEALTRSMWERITAAAEQHNEAGNFTALIGFEWGSVPDGSNLHRNVLFRDDKDFADTIIPFSSYDSEDPEDLWNWMAAYEEKTGGRLLALAHNGNLSNGRMFDDVTFEGKPLTRDYVERRMRWEPLYEVTQMKGDGEAHPSISPNDEFADFETWDKGSFKMAKEEGMIEREYAREAYKRGLSYEKKLGVNPFKFGLVGSTDAHTSLATTREDNFFGKVTPVEPSANEPRFGEKVTGYMPDPEGRDYTIYHRSASASGLAAVWARENTREAIWDAMKRKEVYASTGTRLLVRVFAGWDFEPEEVDRWDFAKNGYERGVPMGGDLRNAPKGKAPVFMIRSLRDADGANLDRVQIIKGWLDESGKTHEQIYDVAVSDGRKIDKEGHCKTSVGNTVNVEEATYSNSIGDPLLLGYWKDPDFDAQQKAFYYVRVIEIPTPRWTTYDAKFFGVERPKDVPASIQDRAYTSPIWYTP